MAVTFSRHRVRYRIDQAKSTGLVNEFTNSTAEIFRARAVQFDLGIFYNGALCSVANLSSITIEVKGLNADGTIKVDDAPLMTKTVNAADMDDTLDAASWSSKAKQHASVGFDVSETGLDMTGAVRNKRRLGIIITAVTNEVSPQRLTLGVDYIEMIKDGGVTSANTPAPGDPQYLTSDETKALLASYVPIMGTPGGYIRLVNNQGKAIMLMATPDTDTPALETPQTT